MPTGFEPCVVDEVKFGYHQNCAISIWEQTHVGVTNALKKQDELIGYLSEQHPQSVVQVVVICRGNMIPGSAQRKEIEAHLERWSKSWRASVQVAEGNDLWSVTARSVMTALRLMQRRPWPTKICSDTTEASQWATQFVVGAEQTSSEEIASGLHGAIEQLRARKF